VQKPHWQIVSADSDPQVILTGDWTLAAIARLIKAELPGGELDILQKRFAGAAAGVERWDLSGLHRLDSAGALLLWRVWGGRRPRDLRLDVEAERAIRRIESANDLPRPEREWHLEALALLGERLINAGRIVVGMLELAGQLLLDFAHVLRHPRDFPWRELSASVYKTAVTALPITGMLGFLVGVVMSYLMAIQLRNFGADTFIINILGYGIMREFGPMLMAVLVAGRSGSAMTAQIGLMRVTEEIDALATMGISRSQRIVLPKVLALAISGSLLALWTSAMALFGGMLAAEAQLDIDLQFFFFSLPGVVPLGTVWIGVLKGAVFCTLIGLIACYFGLNVRPNTESLSARTTLSVVVSITVVILADAVLAVLTREIGVPFR
jgi:phospholipid/cholesterol/gamma-HCH transport system permease protein